MGKKRGWLVGGAIERSIRSASCVASAKTKITYGHGVKGEGGALVEERLEPEKVVWERGLDERDDDAGEVDVGHHLLRCLCVCVVFVFGGGSVPWDVVVVG